MIDRDAARGFNIPMPEGDNFSESPGFQRLLVEALIAQL
ncbi:hypothetical protein MITS9504_03530 [Synechococcus sp. MIT S9504]|nr:hypothetical protein MITS9504_03530 [Synechococcus sp. MIT S9504]